MINKDNIISFLNYNYTAFSKKQCVFRIFWLWILSVLCFIVQVPIALKCSVLLFDFVISSIFIVLIAKFSKNKVSRYLCDGLFCLYIAIILNIASCGFLSLFINSNGILYLVFLLLLVLCAIITYCWMGYTMSLTKENYQQKYERNKIKLRWATIGSLLMFAITIGFGFYGLTLC